MTGADLKTPIYRIGQSRYRYLDLANMTFAQGAFAECNGYIAAFLETIEEGSELEKKLRIGFDEIEMERRSKIHKLEEKIKDMGYLEQKDEKNNGRERIEIEAILNRKNICWTVSLQKGLFYE